MSDSTTTVTSISASSPRHHHPHQGNNLSLHLPLNDATFQTMKLRISETGSQDGEKDGEKRVPSPTTPSSYEQRSPLPMHRTNNSVIGTTTPASSDWVRSADIAKMGNLPYLSGMRAIASIMIQFYHISKGGTRKIDFFAAAALTTHFVQGGFLITGALLHLQAANRGRPLTRQHAHVPRFFIGRWVRLYPALIILIVLNSIWWQNRYHKATHLAKAIFRTLFKIQHTSILDIPENPSNPFAHTWFLDVQEAFYLFWALALPYIAMMGTKRRMIILIGLAAWSFRTRLGVDRFNATLPINLFKMVAGASLQLVPIPRVFIQNQARSVAVGTLIAFFVWGFSNYLQDNFSSKEARIQGEVAGAIAFVVVTMAAISKPASMMNSAAEAGGGGGGTNKEHTRRATLSDPTTFLPPDFTPLSFLNMQWLGFVGRVSYSWYLWQVPMMHYESKFQVGYPAVGSTAEAFIIAMCSTIWIEEPIRNMYQASRKKARMAAVIAKEHSSH